MCICPKQWLGQWMSSFLLLSLLGTSACLVLVVVVHDMPIRGFWVVFFVALCFEQFVVSRGRDAVHVFWYGTCAHKRSFSSGVDINLGPNVASPGERYKLRHRSINRLEPSCLRFKIPRHPRRRITGRSRGEGKNCLVTNTPPFRFLSLSLSWRPRAL